MRPLLILLTTAMLSPANAPQEPKISVFCNHIESVARQENMPFADAAKIVREIGYTAADVYVTQNPEELDILDQLGFQHDCCIAEISFTTGDQEEAVKQAFDFMVKRNYNKVMLVPGHMPDNATPDDLADCLMRCANFIARAKALGIETVFEDFDNRRSPTKDIAGIKKFFDYCPDAKHAFDTGNYAFSGDDCLRAFAMFKDKITHVHLKDRVSKEDLKCPPVGTGCMPIEAVIKLMLYSGYDGWFVAEMFGNRTMLESLKTSYTNIYNIITEAYAEMNK